MNIKTDQKKYAFLTIIFIVALIIRIAYSLYMAGTFTSSGPWGNGLGYSGDSHLYHRVAYNLYKGNGFSGSFSGESYGIPLVEVNQFKPLFTRGPVYPLFVSLVYKFVCNPEDMESTETWIQCWNRVRIVQSILDASVCLLVFFLVQLMYPASFWPAIIASGLHAFNVYGIFFTKDLMSVSMDTFLLVSMILLYVNGLSGKKNFWWIASGMLLGIIVLSRPEFVLSIFILTAFIFVVSQGLTSDKLKKSLVFIISAFIIISPWTIRNYVVFKQPILVSTGGLGFNLFAGTWWSHDAWEWGQFPAKIFKDEKEHKRANEVRTDYNFWFHAGTLEIMKSDNVLKGMALDRMREDPAKVFWTWTKRIPCLWWQNCIQAYAIKLPPGIFFVFYFVFAVYAFLIAKREEKNLMWPVGLLFIYLTMALLPFAVVPRYGTPLIPGIISLTGIGIWKTIARFKSTHKQKESII